ncbi:MAG: DDE transposase, partial [Acetivibrionales bacterium]
VIYHQRSTEAESRMQVLLADADKLLTLCGSDYENVTEYELFARCLLEQTVVENEKRRLRKKEDGTEMIT